MNHPTTTPPAYTRSEVWIPSGNEQLAGWFYTPAGDGPHPAVVMAHGFGAVRGMALDSFAGRFAAAGLVTVAFDYRRLGASTGAPRQLIDIDDQVDDIRAVLRWLRAQPTVDPQRLALWGTSFGGGNVVLAARDEPDLGAAVIQCPLLDGLDTARRLGLRHVARIVPAVTADLVRAALGRRPAYLPIVADPGEPAVVDQLGAVDGWYGLVTGALDGAPFDNRAAARVNLRIPLHRPYRHAAAIRCPLLVVVCEHDSLASPARATEVADAAPQGEALHVDSDHFGIYHEPLFDQVATAETVFLQRHLGAAEQAASERAGGAS